MAASLNKADPNGHQQMDWEFTQSNMNHKTSKNNLDSEKLPAVKELAHSQVNTTDVNEEPQACAYSNTRAPESLPDLESKVYTSPFRTIWTPTTSDLLNLSTAMCTKLDQNVHCSGFQPQSYFMNAYPLPSKESGMNLPMDSETCCFVSFRKQKSFKNDQGTRNEVVVECNNSSESCTKSKFNLWSYPPYKQKSNNSYYKLFPCEDSINKDDQLPSSHDAQAIDPNRENSQILVKDQSALKGELQKCDENSSIEDSSETINCEECLQSQIHNASSLNKIHSTATLTQEKLNKLYANFPKGYSNVSVKSGEYLQRPTVSASPPHKIPSIDPLRQEQLNKHYANFPKGFSNIKVNPGEHVERPTLSSSPPSPLPWLSRPPTW